MIRVENIVELIDKLEDDMLLGQLFVNKYEGIDWENFTWENLDMKKAREDTKRLIKTDSLHCVEAIEEHLCKCNSLNNIIFNEEYKIDMTHRCSDWMKPFLSIFKYYGWDFGIDYVNEDIQMKMEEDHEDFAQRLGIGIDDLLSNGAYNSFLYYEFEKEIRKLYDRVRRNEKIEKLKNNINYNGNRNIKTNKVPTIIFG